MKIYKPEKMNDGKIDWGFSSTERENSCKTSENESIYCQLHINSTLLSVIKFHVLMTKN